jgi:hypothetical protein
MRRIVGAYLFEHEWRSWSPEEARTFIGAVSELGVDSLVTESDTLDADLLDAVREAGLRLWAAVSLFSDHANANAVLDERPQLRPVLETGRLREPLEWYVGTIPTDDRYTAERLAVVEQLARAHEPDGLIVDFARWPLHWELECRPDAGQPPLSSYDEISLRRFREQTGVDVPDVGAANAARWIAAHAWRQWIDFRVATITAVIRDATERVRRHSPTMPVGVFTVPLHPDELELLVGQRLSELGEVVDLVFPMTYHAILHREPRWIGEIVQAHDREAGVPAIPVVQVDARLGAQFGADWGPSVPPEEWSAVLTETLDRSGETGLVAFPGSELLRPDRGPALRRAVAARSEVHG